MDEMIHVARIVSGQETKLSMTSNSLVSPADLEPESDFDQEIVKPRTVDEVDPNAIVVNFDEKECGVLSSKELSP